ncbi:MAG: diaminopimelate decarboxylase [Bacteroidaceae bacterium]|nr:diaminopimelate decarboxylase [Bacteroidaceae bacterium]
MDARMKTDYFREIPTPFYYYDRELLEKTLTVITEEMGKADNCHLHYAVKANTNADVLKVIADYGFGADCVSGWEIESCVKAGFEPRKMVFAGVAKSDWEIQLALEVGIDHFNVESVQELEVIDEIAGRMGVEARVALRINPNVGAHTHANITTGLAENKFGIDIVDMVPTAREAMAMEHVRLVGLHFHIGSQITEMDDFEALAAKINELQDQLEAAGIGTLENINVGGGLGIDYYNPDENPIPDFANYFKTYREGLRLRKGQRLHFELGRAVVGQMGSLIAKVIYVKTNKIKKFAILDAGFTDLIRPALYGAYHKVENITSESGETDKYDVVGPICESTDVFVKDYELPTTKRGDYIAFRSAGAYGEIMASGYNCRPLPKGYLL